MNRMKLKLEYLLFGVAFLLGLVIRLAGANRLLLSNHEADLALQALSLSRGEAVMIGPHPAYLALTTGFMFLFGASDWAARFWPAVAGSLLVLLPVLFRGRIGRLPAVLLAFFLALDPAMLAVSRQAGSASFALFFILLAVGLWINQRTALAGVAAGLALVSGPQVWPGLLGLGIAAWVARLLNRQIDRGARDVPAWQEFSQPSQYALLTTDNSLSQEVRGQGHWRRGLVYAAATIFFAGTLFFVVPGGLSAMADSVTAYVRGWAAADTGVAAGLLLIGLLVYELFPLLFGVWGFLSSVLQRSEKGAFSRTAHPIDRFLLAWFIIALTLALVYPARQVQDLCWALLPLWGLAARQIARLVTVPAYDRLPMVGHMVLTAVILGYISMALIMSASGAVTDMREYRVYVAGAIIMLVSSTGLIAWGWSPVVSLRGLSWGIGIILLLFCISGGWNSVGLSGRGEELWTTGPRLRDADLLSGTIRDLDVWNGSIVGGPDLVVVGNTSPSLRWLLRGVRQIRYVSQLPADTNPALVITTTQSDLALAATYRGQDLILSESTRWQQFGQAEWKRWLAFRSVPFEALQQDWVILWARVDLFPGGLDTAPTSATPRNSQPQPISE